VEKKRALEIMFQPSSRELESLGKRLSVWIEQLTLADQAWAFMGCNPKKTVVACLSVDDICAIEPPESLRALRVEWEKALKPDGTPNELPGAEGHVGITGLVQGGDGKIDKKLRKALRSKLADLAFISLVPVPHDIPEDFIRVAAYFIYKNEVTESRTPDLHWIAAVRQIRRTRAHEVFTERSF
jgi:hypothetical protein